MAFVNLSLMFGAALLAIPIVLHLVMRQQPKQLVFPALRFIKQREDANRRQLQLRHWLLLLLRCLGIVLLAVALARPSVPSLTLGNWIIIGCLAAVLLLVGPVALLAAIQRRGKIAVAGLGTAVLVLALALAWMLRTTLARDEPSVIGNQQAPVAAVLVFDASPRMQYVWQNKTRLERAKEIASWLIRQLPGDSEVAVVDSRPGGAAFAVDLAAAERAIERMEMTSVPRPMPGVVDEAIGLARASIKTRREVYVFTDLARAAWTSDDATRLQRRLAEATDTLLYVVDVGVEQPQNTMLGVPRLAAELLPKSSELQLQVPVACTGAGGACTVELHLESPDPELPVIRDGKTVLPFAQLRGQQAAEVADNGAQTVAFRVGGLELGTHQGRLKLTGQDGLAWDDVRYFTVEVQAASPVLVLAPPGVTTKFLTEALAPYEFRETEQARFECTVTPLAELPNAELDQYAAVCLVDPTPLTPPDWEKLATSVRGGGGLALFLGHNAEPAAFNHPSAHMLIGGKLARQWRSAGDLFLTTGDLSHPILSNFRDMATSVPWDRFPVYRHWILEELAAGTRVLMAYSNSKPAVLETVWGRGHVVTMTTPVSDPAQLRGRQTWNELPTGDDAWPYVVLVNEMLEYLVQTTGTKLNYLAGETAVLASSRGKHPERYQLFTPLDRPQDVTAAEGRITVRFTEYPGAYRLKGFLGEPIVRGFSVNLPEHASDLTRLRRDALDAILGAERYQYARSEDEIVRGVGEARLGREFYPFLLPLVALVLALEHLLANRFYRPQAMYSAPAVGVNS